MKSELNSHSWGPLAGLLPPLAAFAIQSFTWIAFRHTIWLPLYYPAVFFAAWHGGLEWGILATAGSVAMAWWAFNIQGFSRQMGYPSMMVMLGIFLSMGLVISWMLERLLRAKAFAEADLRDIQEQEGGKAQLLADLLDRVSDGEVRTLRLFEHMTSGFARCRMIFRDGHPVDCDVLETNPAFTRLTGLHGAVGRRASEVHPTLAAENPGLFDAFGRVATSGTAEHLEVRLEPQGAWFSANLYCPVPGEFIILFEEITEQKRTQQALKKANRRMEMATRAAELGLWEWDCVTGKSECDERMLELYAMPPTARTEGFTAWVRRLHPEDRETAVSDFQRALDGTGDYHGMFRIVLADGRVRLIVADAAIERDTHGKPVRVTGLNREVPAHQVVVAAEAMLPGVEA